MGIKLLEKYLKFSQIYWILGGVLLLGSIVLIATGSYGFLFIPLFGILYLITGMMVLKKNFVKAKSIKINIILSIIRLIPYVILLFIGLIKGTLLSGLLVFIFPIIEAFYLATAIKTNKEYSQCDEEAMLDSYEMIKVSSSTYDQYSKEKDKAMAKELTLQGLLLAQAEQYINDQTYITHIEEEEPENVFNVYNVQVTGGYGWEYIKSTVDYLAANEFAVVTDIYVGNMQQQESKNLRDEYTSNGNQANNMEMLKNEYGYMKIAGYSNTLQSNIMVVFINQTNVFRVITTNRYHITIIKNFVETMVRRTFNTPDAMKSALPIEASSPAPAAEKQEDESASIIKIDGSTEIGKEVVECIKQYNQSPSEQAYSNVIIAANKSLFLYPFMYESEDMNDPKDDHVIHSTFPAQAQFDKLSFCEQMEEDPTECKVNVMPTLFMPDGNKYYIDFAYDYRFATEQDIRNEKMQCITALNNGKQYIPLFTDIRLIQHIYGNTARIGLMTYEKAFEYLNMEIIDRNGNNSKSDAIVINPARESFIIGG